jgi:hypothetical protein
VGGATRAKIDFSKLVRYVVQGEELLLIGEVGLWCNDFRTSGTCFDSMGFNVFSGQSVTHILAAVRESDRRWREAQPRWYCMITAVPKGHLSSGGCVNHGRKRLILRLSWPLVSMAFPPGRAGVH